MRGLRWLLAGEGLNSGAVMLALTTPFVLFLDELGLSKGQIGLLNSLIHLSAPLALIIAPAVERFGLKRTDLTFMSTRNAVLCCIVLLPWMIAGMGFDLAFICAIGLMGMYGLLRVIAEIALYPWMVEVIPNSVRGRFSAVSSMGNDVISTIMCGTIDIDHLDANIRALEKGPLAPDKQARLRELFGRLKDSIGN